MNTAMINKVVFLLVLIFSSGLENVSGQAHEDLNYVQLSQHLLQSLKDGQPTYNIEELLSQSTEEDISKQLLTDHQKIAFWVNIYNAFIQIRLKEDPKRYEKRNKFFNEKFIEITGRKMSFSDIEHGIIRRSQWIYGLGRIRNPFAPGYQKRLCPVKREPRVHFALNCGAKSCPPVAIYDPEKLNNQLDIMTQNFLSKFSSFDKEKNEVNTTPLFSWFRGDFGGKKGIKEVLKQYGVIPHAKVSLKFDDYDWSLYLDNYIEIKEQ